MQYLITFQFKFQKYQNLYFLRKLFVSITLELLLVDMYYHYLNFL